VYVHPSAPGLTCELLPTVRSLFLASRDHHAVAATAPRVGVSPATAFAAGWRVSAR